MNSIKGIFLQNFSIYYLIQYKDNINERIKQWKTWKFEGQIYGGFLELSAFSIEINILKTRHNTHGANLPDIFGIQHKSETLSKLTEIVWYHFYVPSNFRSSIFRMLLGINSNINNVFYTLEFLFSISSLWKLLLYVYL